MRRLNLKQLLEFSSEEIKIHDLNKMLEHHLSDIKEALIKCSQALKNNDYKEVMDNAIIMQSSALDLEELITNQKPKV